MPTTTTIIKKIIAALKWPRKILSQIQYAQDIHDDMDGNAYFTGSATKITKLATDLTTVKTAEDGMKKTPPTHTSGQRNAALKLVKGDCESLQLDVQDAADSDPENAEDIITSAGMKATVTAIRQKQQTDAKDDMVTGDVILTAPDQGPHEWQITADKIAITTLPATSGAKTRVPNLPQAAIMFQRNRKILKKGQVGEWSDWKKFVVKGGISTT